MAYHATVVKGDGSKEQRNAMEEMHEMFGPGHVDQSVRQTIQACWMALPRKRRTVQEVEKQIRRIMDRALKDFREDAAAFGKNA